ncbi:myeloid differentiation primary response protein MyD88-like [Lingula anatina]|uniref:Myeloid differentiation primary response protein MyD88-like n=1 Tax=Lingula anatina TaxID=7574 RepID=A0A1S3K0L2_LINAN|nr:myeloid differentiation primary response protein MyD88-like [Lingula anatina]|eukprot:XP_013416180.1 myeloid differentiation primary response protein MyD88-like [Lingula anatina]
MASGMDVAGPPWYSEYREVPVRALNRSVRNILARLLNPPSVVLTDSGFSKDWKGLAELMGFMNDDISNFESMRDSYTLLILKDWEKQKDSMIATLFDYIQQLERYDILEDPTIKTQVENNVKSYLQRQSKEMEIEKPLQDCEVSSAMEYDDMKEDQYKYMTTQDVQTGKAMYYDAFVSYAEEDIGFVKKLISELEKPEYGLKLCVQARDLIPGASTNTVCAKLIEERCTRMVIILSPKFLNSAQCDFQIKFAQSLSPGSRGKKLVPIMYKCCDIPSILRHIAICDYTKQDLQEWFWNRLAMSLKAPGAQLSSQDKTSELDNLFLSMSSSSSSEFSWTQSSSPPTSSDVFPPIYPTTSSASSCAPPAPATSGEVPTAEAGARGVLSLNDIGQIDSDESEPTSDPPKHKKKEKKKKGKPSIFSKFKHSSQSSRSTHC